MAILGVTDAVSFADFMEEAKKHQEQSVRFAEMFLSAIVASNGQFSVNITNEETKKYLEKHGRLWHSVDAEYAKKYQFK
jgi:hypothetical protein